MSYFFHPEAEAEYLDSIAFYESRQNGLGALFLFEFEAKMEKICKTPEAYEESAMPGIRRAVLNRFPYSILFCMAGGRVQVLAVAHQRRRPLYWLERFESSGE